MDGDGEPGDAIFIVQPEEMSCYKSLRRVVDSVFVTIDRFLLTSLVYADIEDTEDGINRHLRSMLFVPSRRRRRGVPRAARGVASESSIEGMTAVKQTQKQSKQKERCENRLISLLFATIYDPATKQCRLVPDVPPLKLRRLDKNGQPRNVSNYTDVRMYLRSSMASILSAYSDSVNVLAQLLPAHMAVLPVLFPVIARTLMVIISVDEADCTDANQGTLRRRANAALDYCMTSIQNFITTWERRNFSTDNPLIHCVKAGIDNEYYEAVRKVLEAMIAILPPTGREPYDRAFRDQHLFLFGSPKGGRFQVHSSGGGCVSGMKCPETSRNNSELLQDTYYSKTSVDVAMYFSYVEELSKCAALPPTLEFEVLNNMMEERDFSTAIWRYCEGICTLRRLQSMCRDFRTENGHDEETVSTLPPGFVEKTQTDIASCWSAIGRSNVRTCKLLEELNLKNVRVKKETVVELIFGCAIASMALFERENEVIPISAKLRSKKGPVLVKMNQDLSDMEGSNDNGVVGGGADLRRSSAAQGTIADEVGNGGTDKCDENGTESTKTGEGTPHPSICASENLPVLSARNVCQRIIPDSNVDELVTGALSLPVERLSTGKPEPKNLNGRCLPRDPSKHEEKARVFEKPKTRRSVRPSQPCPPKLSSTKTDLVNFPKRGNITKKRKKRRGSTSEVMDDTATCMAEQAESAYPKRVRR